MKISIITVCFNSSLTIKDTIDSVITQSYEDIEFIIMDGASTDNTVSIVKEYIASGYNIKLFSEPDKGIYNAMNKGLNKATGDIIGFLNADDFYFDKEVLQNVADQFHDQNIDGLYGNLYYVDEKDTNKISRKWIAGNYSYNSFKFGWMPPHPTFFVKKSVYDRLGLYNESFKIAGDYELMLRFLYKGKINLYYLDKYLVKMRSGGVSNISVSNRLMANAEDKKAWRINDLQPYIFTLTLKPLRKIFQFSPKFKK